MKRILAFVLTAILLCVSTVPVFAEGKYLSEEVVSTTNYNTTYRKSLNLFEFLHNGFADGRPRSIEVQNLVSHFMFDVNEQEEEFLSSIHVEQTEQNIEFISGDTEQMILVYKYDNIISGRILINSDGYFKFLKLGSSDEGNIEYLIHNDTYKISDFEKFSDWLSQYNMNTLNPDEELMKVLSEGKTTEKTMYNRIDIRKGVQPAYEATNSLFLSYVPVVEKNYEIGYFVDAPEDYVDEEVFYETGKSYWNDTKNSQYCYRLLDGTYAVTYGVKDTYYHGTDAIKWYAPSNLCKYLNILDSDKNFMFRIATPDGETIKYSRMINNVLYLKTNKNLYYYSNNEMHECINGYKLNDWPEANPAGKLVWETKDNPLKMITFGNKSFRILYETNRIKTNHILDKDRNIVFDVYESADGILTGCYYLSKDSVYSLPVEYTAEWENLNRMYTRTYEPEYTEYIELGFEAEFFTSGYSYTYEYENEILVPLAEYHRLWNENMGTPTYVAYNDQILAFDTPPVIENDRTLIPLRFLFETMEAEVSWNADTNEATVKYADKTVTVQIDNNIATINGEEYQLDVPARLINDKTMVPLRFISEGLGFTVDWDEENRIAEIR